MTDVSKMEMALLIIANIRPAWAHWKVFFDTAIPEQNRRVESLPQYHDRCSLLVRLEACRWLAERLDGWRGVE